MSPRSEPLLRVAGAALAYRGSRVLEGVDFALLDYDLATGTSIPVAVLLADRRIPFYFVSALTLGTPARFQDVLHVLKPFLPHHIQKAVEVA